MTSVDRMELLRRVCAEHGQSNVARRIGRTPGCISQILSGTYKADSAIVLQLVEEAYGCTTIDCPVLGEPITLGRCAEERRKLPRNTNPVARLLTQTCPTCEQRKL